MLLMSRFRLIIYLKHAPLTPFIGRDRFIIRPLITYLEHARSLANSDSALSLNS